MERREYPPLRLRLNVDENIPATDNIHSGKGRVFGHVVPRKDTRLANQILDLISTISPGEEAPQAGFRNVIGDCGPVQSVPGTFERWVTNVSAEYLYTNRQLLLRDVFLKANCE